MGLCWKCQHLGDRGRGLGVVLGYIVSKACLGWGKGWGGTERGGGRGNCIWDERRIKVL